MKTLWRLTVIVLCLFLTIVNTTETEEIITNELSKPESLHSDENDSTSESQEITRDYEKTLYNEYEKRRRLQSIHDNLATKLQKALVKKLKSPEYSNRVNLTKVEKYLEHDIDLPSGRRSFNNVPEIEEIEEIPNDDGRRNYLQAVNTATRSGYIVKNGIKVPYGYSNDNIIKLPNYYIYGQPYLDLGNSNRYYNYYPGHRIIKFNNNFFDYSNHVRAYNNMNDFKQVAAYLLSLMHADNYNNPNVNYILKGAYDLNLAEINNFDRTQLVQIGKTDLDYLKKYIILILNKYGMTPYVFKLLEYVNLVEGRPMNEVYLVFKILSNQQAVYGLNKVESDQLKAHLQYLINEYGKSPYIIPFVRNIGGIQFETRGQNRLYDFDFGNLDPSRLLNRDYMKKIYVYLSQIYNTNQIILQILQNINRIYDNRNSITILPKLNLNEYQNLYYLSQNDLYLLAKYISQIQRQKGDNTYLNELLIYINKLQTLDKGADVNIIKDDHNIIIGFDLTGLYKILLDINNRKGLKPDIILIINRLLNKKNVAINDIDKIINDLTALKEYLIQNQIYEYDQLLIKILYELSNVRKNENLPPIEEDSEKLIKINLHDLELILQYLTSNEKFRNNPYLIVFINEIIQIIQRGRFNPYENITYMFRYADLLKLYNTVQIYEKDKENPIYVMILHYLNQDKENDDFNKHDDETIANPDLDVIMKYFGDNQINLNNIYKFLLYEIESGNQKEDLFELLQLLQRTLLLPNGELKINVIRLNETQPYRQIKPNDLQKLYLYLQELIEDKIIRVHLIDFYRNQKRKDELSEELFYNASKESLNRLRNYLLILIKKHGENPYILEVLIEINHILDVPDDKKYIINATNSEVNEDDLSLLIKYFSELNLTGNNINIIKIIEYLQQAKDNIQKGDTKDWIYINAQDLEVIYQYLLGKEKFLHSPYLALFVNEILPLIQRGKLNPYENIIYKFKYVDLLQLYNLILSDEKDRENPVYIMILKYLNLDNDTKKNNGTMPIDLNKLKEYFGDQINLDLIYKFLTYEVESGNPDNLLLELLRFIKTNLLLPNGQLIIKMINLNDKVPLEEIEPNNLQILYLYLQKLIKHERINVKLFEYMKRQKEKEKLIIEIFSDVTQETLIRVRNYLLKLLKDTGENQFVLDILFEINEILGIPKTYDNHEHALNGTKYEINDAGIKLLIKYFTEINKLADSSDVINILSYLYETQNRINEENNTKEKLIYININDLKQIYEYLISKEFINNPYLITFMNKILPFIKQENQNPYENLANQLRHIDLQTIFNLIISQEKDKENPIYKKILIYLDQYKDIKNNGTTPNVDLHLLYEYFGEDQVNLEIVYKFLIHEIQSGNTNEVLIEFLQFIKNNLLLPNGLLRTKIIYFNSPEPTGELTSNELRKIYLYLQKLMEDDNTRIKLLDYRTIYRQIFELFSYAPKASLNRIRNFLLVLIKEQGQNRYIAEVLSEINIILGIPESKNDHMYVLNGTNPEIDEGDLKLLIKYFTLINISDNNTDITKILKFLDITEERIKNKDDKNNTWIYMNPQDLEVMYQYLLGKDKFINSPYLVIFVNEILPFIHKAKQRQYENLLYKFKYIHLLELYNTVLKNEKDKENPIYLMILQYLNDFKDDTKNNETPEINFNILNEYFKDKRINIDMLYKFLSHEIESGSRSKELVELLQFIKRTLILPNGQLKVKVVYINGTDPNIHPYDLQKLYFYLQRLVENEIVGIEFIDYTKKYEQKEKQMHDIFTDVTPESLIRLRNLLLILIKKLGDNPFILDLIFEINHILGIPENSDNQSHILNGTSYEINEKDLDLLIRYFNEVNIYGKNSDLINILDFLQDTKENIKHNKEDSDGQWVSVNVQELELIYQYLLSNENFLNSPYAMLFINEIRPLIQQGKEHPNQNIIYKFRTMDLLKIYKFLLSHEKDKENPIFIKIIHYLDEATNNIPKHDNGTDVDLHVLNEYFGDNEINLDTVYNFLLHEINIGNPNKDLLQLLEVLKRIQLPNGQFKNKIIHLNETEPKQINPNDLQEIYLYLQKLINDNTLGIDLLEYYTKHIQEYKQIRELLNNTPKESLNRLRNYLLLLMKEGEGNPVILEIIFEINRILGNPENDDKYRPNLNVDENDLEVLKKILLLITGPDVDILKIIDNVIETKKRIKDQQENVKKSKLFKIYILEIMDDKNVSPDVKFILDTILQIGLNNLNQSKEYSDFDLILRKAIDNLSPECLDNLTNYLQMIIYKFHPVYVQQKLLPYVEKIKENHKNDINKHTNKTNDNIIVNITRHNLDILNNYLIELIKQYGENPNIVHIIYKINNIEVRPDTNIDWYKLITKNTNVAPRIEVSDINEIIKYLLNLINKQGATPELIKIFRDFSKLPKETIETIRKITPINSTHVVVILDNDDVSKIKSNLVKIINDYGSNPFLLNILKYLNPNGQDYNLNRQTNVYTFAKLNQKDLNSITSYILQLIEQGASPECIDILNFIYEINGDVNERKENKQYVLEISKEIKKLRDNNVIETMKNMDRNTLITIYIGMLETLFNTRNMNDFTRIMEKLLYMYNKDESPIKKYIILKWYEYLIRNKGVSYKTLRTPDFINKLLELDDKENDRDVIITTEKIVTPNKYSSDIDKILSELIDNTLRNKPENDSSEDSRKMINDTEDKPNLRDRKQERKNERKTCLKERRKFKHITKVLNKLQKIHRHDIDISDEDLGRLFDILLIFTNQLKHEKHRSKIETSEIIDELENKLLSENKNTGTCEKSDTVKQIISTVVVHLRDIISYLKTTNFTKEEIMIIVKSTLEDDIMPDITAISVQECTAAANKDILDALLSNIYARTYETENIEIEDMASDIELGKLSTEDILKQISKVKSLSASNH